MYSHLGFSLAPYRSNILAIGTWLERMAMSSAVISWSFTLEKQESKHTMQAIHTVPLVTQTSLPCTCHSCQSSQVIFLWPLVQMKRKKHLLYQCSTTYPFAVTISGSSPFAQLVHWFNQSANSDWTTDIPHTYCICYLDGFLAVLHLGICTAVGQRYFSLYPYSSTLVSLGELSSTFPFIPAYTRRSYIYPLLAIHPHYRPLLQTSTWSLHGPKTFLGQERMLYCQVDSYMHISTVIAEKVFIQ